VSDHAHGGNDTLIGDAGMYLVGDAGTMDGDTRGGNDTLIGDDGSLNSRCGDTTANRAAALKAIKEIRASGIVSARGIARELTARRVPTPTGSSTWAPAQVQRLRANSE
jgi:hypothetical protein